jgi:hypothetical protein
VKRSGRDEPVWVAIHKRMEAMLRISLYSYLYLKLAKMQCLSCYLLCFLFNKIREHEGEAGGLRVKLAHTMYTYVSKCKSDKKDLLFIFVG